jgi:hypothetical protein
MPYGSKLAVAGSETLLPEGLCGASKPADIRIEPDPLAREFQVPEEEE